MSDTDDRTRKQQVQLLLISLLWCTCRMCYQTLKEKNQ